MSFGNKLNSNHGSIKSDFSTLHSSSLNPPHIHKDQVPFPVEVSDLSNIVDSLKMTVLKDGLVAILNKRSFLLKQNRKFITSHQIFRNLPKELQEIFYYYKFSDNRVFKTKFDSVLFLDAPLDVLSEQNIDLLLNQIQVPYKYYYLNIVDFKTRFPSYYQNSLSKLFEKLKGILPVEKEELFELEAGTHIEIIKDHLLFGFSAVEFYSVMSHYNLKDFTHDGSKLHSYPMTPFSDFEVYTNSYQEKDFYRDNNFNQILEKAINKNDGETLYHLLGKYLE